MIQERCLLRIRDIKYLTGLDRSIVYWLEATGSFPARVKRSLRPRAWRCADVAAWIAGRILQ